ncbi:hypothetical protein [Capillimicrobium parvum]|nr:hypothetical protein [Capillimicrobium parvum]
MRRPPGQETMQETDDIGAAIRAAAATVSAPATLRERVVADQDRGRVRHRRRFGLFASAGAVAAALIVALVLTLPGGGTAPVDQAAELALSEPAGAPPAPMAGTNRLKAVVDDVAFPDWSASHGWRAVGQRTGQVDGREAKTVFYENDAGRRIGYTVVSGPPIAVPDGRRRTVAGTDVTLLRHEGATVATWRARGQTCVLAAEDVSGDELAKLASWTGYSA